MLDFSHEQHLMHQGYPLVAGVDEVGRGPLAGPVTAAAVVLKNPQILLGGVQDSKKLSPKKRAALYPLILENAYVGVGHASVEEIDAVNILQATFLAMRRALQALPCGVDYILVDGNKTPPHLPAPAQSIIKGDGVVLSIAAASIVAKVVRDGIMQTLAAEYPQFGWESNAGYGSKHHMAALQAFGPTPHHRRSFMPVAALISSS